MSEESEFSVFLGTPNFDPEHPDTWFVQIEAIFQLRGITERATWFQYAVAALPNTIASQFKEIVSKRPDNNSYDRLKKAVISRFSVL